MTEIQRRLIILKGAIETLRSGGLASQLQPLGMLADTQMADAICEEVDAILKLLDVDPELETESELLEMTAGPEIH